MIGRTLFNWFSYFILKLDKSVSTEVIYKEKSQFVQASGNVRMQKDEYTAYGDVAETTTAMEKFKLKGHVKVEKGGKWND